MPGVTQGAERPANDLYASGTLLRCSVVVWGERGVKLELTMPEIPWLWDQYDVCPMVGTSRAGKLGVTIPSPPLRLLLRYCERGLSTYKAHRKVFSCTLLHMVH
jgi:hypothetical protein